MTSGRIRTCAALVGALVMLVDARGAFAMTIAPPDVPSDITLVVRGARVGGVGRVYRAPGVAVRRPVGAYHRPPGYYGGAWRRPYYGWGPGGAIAAGAAIGFVTAAAAASYVASRPPAPGLCWYYTDASRRSGFWDNCP